MPASSSPLQGKRILVTRAKEQAVSFSEKIAELGGIPIEIPLIKIQPPKNTELIKRTLENILAYDWLVLTSVNGVHYFFDFLKKFNISFDKEASMWPKIAVVGKKTLEALEEKGYTADLIPEKFVAEDLLEKLVETVVAGETLLLARGNLGRLLLPEKLAEIGIKVDDLVIYETVLNMEKQMELLHLLKNHSIDMITFTSSSTVTNFVALLQGTNWQDWMDDVQIVCIGPITENTALEAGIKVDIVAEEYTIAGLIDAIINR
ncbi:MAG TPA: uroporphyrinogen-III synthase [Bacillus bacterium]|nr:uroporphyrinogen-III synthase [Bacillus sp. (in: firmicutes)]